MTSKQEITNPITLIAAIGLDRTIGLNNAMPWHLPEDLRFFKERTLGKVMIMGKNTFASIGRPLPGRTTIIISRTQQSSDYPYPNCHVVSNLDQALSLASSLSANDQEIIIAGGGQVYSQALPLATRLVLTIIQKEFKGDTFFPEWDTKNWQLISQQDFQRETELSYSFQEFHIKNELFHLTFVEQ